MKGKGGADAKKVKRLPIGFSDYKRIIDDDFYYVDKTLLIEELLNHGGAVTLIPRPRRFGKTLNLSMLKYFFEKTTHSHSYLFEDKNIWHCPEARAMQGRYPVIFMTLKSVKEKNWQTAHEKFIHLIAREYNRHRYLLAGETLNGDEKTTFMNIISLRAAESDYHASLLNLSEFLERSHGKRTVIIIDEYDAPLHEALLQGYYQEVVTFMRSFLGDGLKDNSSLELCVITGILRTAKEGIFSGLNHLEVFTILEKPFADKFGFTEQEIDQLLRDYALEEIKNDFKAWYNGYLIGNVKIYNPWSSLKSVKEGGELLPYWANTSGNELIAKIIATATPQIKDSCAELLKGNPLRDIQISDKMVLQGMLSDSTSIWSLLLFAGYLTVASYRLDEGIPYADLVLPNKELLVLFKDLIGRLFTQRLDASELTLLDEALQQANGELFSTLLSKFIMQSVSWHDLSDQEPENSYHLFVLGLLVVLSKSYIVRSNRESGHGRYDIVLIPLEKSRPGIVIEFKKKKKGETMAKCAERALQQIVQKHYASELHSAGIETIVLFAVAFHKKELLLKQAVAS